MCESTALIAFAVRFVVVTTLVLAGAAKIKSPEGAARMLDMNRASSRYNLHAVVRVLAVAELILAFWLTSGVAIAAAATSAVIVLVGMTTLLATARARGFGGGCGCLGSHDGSSIGTPQFARNVVLVLGCLWVAGHGVACGSVPLWQISLEAGSAAVGLTAVAALGYRFAVAHQELDATLRRISSERARHGNVSVD